MNGASSTRISKEAVKNAVESGKFNNLASFCDHPSWMSGYALERLAGRVTSTQWDEETGIATGTIELYDNDAGRLISSLFKEEKNTPDIGTSMVFFGTTTVEGEDEVIASIDQLLSVDFVFMPAAMTRVLAKLSATNSMNKEKVTPETTVTQTVMTEEQAAKMLIELHQKLTGNTQTAQIETLSAQVDKLQEQLIALSSETAINTPPPQMTQTKQYILSGQRITTTTPEETLKASVEKFFGANNTSVKTFNVSMGSLYRDLTGDVNMNGQWNIANAREATGLSTINEDTFGDLICGCMNKAIIDQWQKLSDSYLWWRKISKSAERSDFTESAWYSGIEFSGMRDLTPGEAVPQAEVSTATSDESTSSWHYPAMMVTIPIQHLENARECAKFRMQPETLAKNAIRKISQDFITLLCSNGGKGIVMPDGDYLFSSRRGNLRTGGAHAISYTAWEQVWGDMMSIKTVAGDELGEEPYGVVTSATNTVKTIQVVSGSMQADTADNNMNPIPIGRNRVVTAPNWTAQRDWMTFTNPNTMPALAFGYRYSEMPHVIPEPNGSNSYGMFTTRSMRWKVEHFYEIGVINPRGLQKRIVG
jgi:hypothetical protein